MYEIIIAILIGLDQIIKYWALNSLKEVNSIPVINNIFSLTYVENRGAAFGMLQNNQSIFILGVNSNYVISRVKWPKKRYFKFCFIV